ncbi:uncharacterized protein BX663DRAFT_499511 [Cokeromyces recurvatus]|uniref:uncharacterized protein n=1 Tax=Cokeromyces recurvatus TaxID=90255 RepID=UPI00221EF1C2|nr:uncharacterized protein BX663DRAFT_499511 [Cokeromyces recurvatus]KAI7905374.1 hypothetical protein BX663DRAFT_499511 [Cokeromyces recurvatus]
MTTNSNHYQEELFLLDDVNNNIIHPFSLHFQQSPTLPTTPDTIDDWLVDELYKSGLISPPNATFDLPNQQDISVLFPITPPITPSVQNNLDNKNAVAPTLPLFPDIAHKQQSPVKKSTTNLPRLAPRPTTPLMNTATALPSRQCASNNKRKLTSTVTMDPDEIALKRQKNTDAARRSRLKKLMKMEQLEKHVSELEADNQKLITRIAVLESEKAGLQSKDNSLEERIKVLEGQLSEAHRALMKF